RVQDVPAEFGITGTGVGQITPDPMRVRRAPAETSTFLPRIAWTYKDGVCIFKISFLASGHLYRSTPMTPEVREARGRLRQAFRVGHVEEEGVARGVRTALPEISIFRSRAPGKNM